MKLLLAFISLVVACTNGQRQNTTPAVPSHIIVNGYAAYEGKAPYIVSLAIRTDGSNTVAVGDGTIIASNWVITAAHCLTTDYVVIYYGSNWARQGQISHTVRKENFIRHNLWPGTNGNDIGLIRTPSVSFNNRINKVALPKFSDKNNAMVNWWTVACGWGGMADGKLADWLQCMDVQIISNDECGRSYGNLPFGIVCTRDDNKSACGGDSGGPLVTHDDPRLVGIISVGGVNCKGPTGYTRIVAHLDWIREKTGIAYY
ncbi:uncharacterized protein Dwil_GK16622 [Drosophila willistoni]|uniref:Peptidase S1 domain-containing protein n=1 Tax=Drosophila willistoni TaxID=7260 RepID=B4MMT1_DROWI|nr:serine protease 1 [Drosophila willistoni]EDW73487.1 uncharacterized protein Dwil_GK16622 [Drosophila willistoni]